tara:strand:+ start:735 stop:1937 length:1203 start_codon:yes stop_codon:yes gene_type:complete
MPDSNVTQINLDDIESKPVVVERVSDTVSEDTMSQTINSQLDDLELLVDPNKSLQNSPVIPKTVVRNSDVSDENNLRPVRFNNDSSSNQPDKIDFSLNVEMPKEVVTNRSFSSVPSVSKSTDFSTESLIEKQELLFKLKRFESRGIPLSSHFSSSSKLSDMKEEYERIKKQRDLENSIRFQKKSMMAFASGVEFLNSKFDPFDIKLDGWSESLHDNLSDYDDVFEELHEKYKTRAKVAPELKLLMMLGGSAAMFHMTNSFFKSAMPNMDDVLKQNPDLAKQFADAAVDNATRNNPGLGNLMGDMINESRNSNVNSNININKSQSMSGPEDKDVERILSQIKEYRNEPIDKSKSIDISPVGLSSSSIESVKTDAPVKKRRGRPPKSKNIQKPDTASFALNL